MSQKRLNSQEMKKTALKMSDDGKKLQRKDNNYKAPINRTKLKAVGKDEVDEVKQEPLKMPANHGQKVEVNLKDMDYSSILNFTLRPEAKEFVPISKATENEFLKLPIQKLMYNMGENAEAVNHTFNEIRALCCATEENFESRLKLVIEIFVEVSSMRQMTFNSFISMFRKLSEMESATNEKKIIYVAFETKVLEIVEKCQPQNDDNMRLNQYDHLLLLCGKLLASQFDYQHRKSNLTEIILHGLTKILDSADPGRLMKIVAVLHICGEILFTENLEKMNSIFDFLKCVALITPQQPAIMSSICELFIRRLDWNV